MYRVAVIYYWNFVLKLFVTCDPLTLGRAPRTEGFKIITDNAFVIGVPIIGLDSVVFQLLQLFVGGPLKERVRHPSPAFGQQHHDEEEEEEEEGGGRRRRSSSGSKRGIIALAFSTCLHAHALLASGAAGSTEPLKENNSQRHE